MHVENRIKELGLKLEPIGKPMSSYAWVRRTGNLLFLAGHGPFLGESQSRPFQGKVGVDFTIEEAKEAARLVCLNCIYSIKEAIGDLDKVKQFVKVMAYVRCVEGMGDYYKVHDGSSDLIIDIFGKEKGSHARMTIGVVETPHHVPIALDMIVEVED